MSLILLLIACDLAPIQTETVSNEPPPTLPGETLPPSALDLNQARGEMLRFDQVEGYRARRLDFNGNTALILQGNPRLKQNQREALKLAERPALVLLVSHDIDLNAAEAYLLGVHGIDRVEVHTSGATEP